MFEQKPVYYMPINPGHYLCPDVGYWGCAEGSGGITPNKIFPADRLEGTFPNGLSWGTIPGFPGFSVQLNGTDQYMTITSAGKLNGRFQGKMTICICFYPTSFVPFLGLASAWSSGSSNQFTIISYGNTAPTGIRFFIRQEGPGYGLRGGTIGPAVKLNEMHLMFFICDGSFLKLIYTTSSTYPTVIQSPTMFPYNGTLNSVAPSSLIFGKYSVGYLPGFLNYCFISSRAFTYEDCKYFVLNQYEIFDFSYIYKMMDVALATDPFQWSTVGRDPFNFGVIS
jgi:hypothetical protein